MLEMMVEDIFTIEGRGTVFLGQVRSGSIAVGDPIICKTSSAEVSLRVIGVEEPRSGRQLEKGEPGSTIAVVCKAIDHAKLAGAWQGDRVVGVTLIPGKKKGLWPF
jgi:translation elongation factor EF-Tu-like GTPase